MKPILSAVLLASFSACLGPVYEGLGDSRPLVQAPDAALFGDGDLVLDSIDALELALAVSKHYGFQLRSDNPDNRQIFGSLRALSAHIEQQRAR